MPILKIKKLSGPSKYPTILLPFAKTILFLLVLGIAHGQQLETQLIGSGGHHATSGPYQLSGTLGEIAVQTYIRSGGVVTQGFQQPANSWLVSLRKPDHSDWTVKIFPNPSIADLIIIITGSRADEVQATIIDVWGRIIPLRQTINRSTGKQQIGIDSNLLTAGLYFIRLLDTGNDQLSTYRFIKTK